MIDADGSPYCWIGNGFSDDDEPPQPSTQPGSCTHPFRDPGDLAPVSTPAPERPQRGSQSILLAVCLAALVSFVLGALLASCATTSKAYTACAAACERAKCSRYERRQLCQWTERLP